MTSSEFAAMLMAVVSVAGVAVCFTGISRAWSWMPFAEGPLRHWLKTKIFLGVVLLVDSLFWLFLVFNSFVHPEPTPERTAGQTVGLVLFIALRATFIIGYWMQSTTLEADDL